MDAILFSLQWAYDLSGGREVSTGITHVKLDVAMPQLDSI